VPRDKLGAGDAAGEHRHPPTSVCVSASLGGM